jgi:hypothetical protein
VLSTQGKNIYKRFRIYPYFKLMSGGHVIDAAEARAVQHVSISTVPIDKIPEGNRYFTS